MPRHENSDPLRRALCLAAAAQQAERRRVTASQQCFYSAADARTDRGRDGEVKRWERQDPRDTTEGRDYRAAVVDQIAAWVSEEKPRALAYSTAHRE